MVALKLTLLSTTSAGQDIVGTATLSNGHLSCEPEYLAALLLKDTDPSDPVAVEAMLRAAPARFDGRYLRAVLEENTTGDTIGEKGNFVTIDERVVFLGGASEGGGTSGGGGGTAVSAADEATPAIDRTTELERLLRTDQPGGLTPAEAKKVAKWLEPIPDEDLARLEHLTYVRDSAALRGLRSSGAVEGAQVSMRGDSLVLKDAGGANAVNGFYDMRTGTVVLAPKGFNQATLLHEIGHAATISQPDMINAASFITTRFNVRSDPVVGGKQQSTHLLSLAQFAGLRAYSFTSDLEFLADAYKVRRAGSREQNNRLDELIREMGGEIAGGLAEALKGFVRIDDRIVFIGGPGEGGGGNVGGGGVAATSTMSRRQVLASICREGQSGGGLTPAEVDRVTEWTSNVPDEDLAHVAEIRLLRSKEMARIAREETGVDRFNLGADGNFSGSHAIGLCATFAENGEYKSYIGLSRTGFNQATILHEIGHATHDLTPTRSRADAALRVLGNLWESGGEKNKERFAELLTRAGLRVYSLSSPQELMADIYMVRRMGSRTQNEKINELLALLKQPGLAETIKSLKDVVL